MSHVGVPLLLPGFYFSQWYNKPGYLPVCKPNIIAKLGRLNHNENVQFTQGARSSSSNVFLATGLILHSPPFGAGRRQAGSRSRTVECRLRYLAWAQGGPTVPYIIGTGNTRRCKHPEQTRQCLYRPKMWISPCRLSSLPFHIRGENNEEWCTGWRRASRVVVSGWWRYQVL